MDNLLPIRKLQPFEFEKYATHLLRLSDNSKYLRFAGRTTDAAIIKFIDNISKKSIDHKIFVIENSELEVVAVGHISLEDNKMELAFSVLSEYEGKGYGNALMQHCIEWCRNRGITSGYMVCLQTNDRIKHLARKHGLSMHSEYGETTAEIELKAPTFQTYSREAFVSTLAAFDYFNKSTIKIANTSIQALRFSY